MARKPLSDLKAYVENKKVHLTFYKSTPFFLESRERKSQSVVRIYRKPEPDFEFGRDYAEFFDGSDYRDAVKIFEGRLKEHNLRKFEFTDKNVSVCRTYSYWISLQHPCNPTGPVPVRVRDPEVWWTHEKIERCMDALVRKHTGWVQKKKFGTTAGGKDINGILAGNRKNMIAFTGTIHAGESGPELLLPALKKILQNDRSLLRKTGVAILPSVNIDEREKLVHGCPWYLRCNSNGVDINRNFDAKWNSVEYGYGMVSSDPDSGTYRGSSPESEPETKAVVNFVDETKPTVVFSFHALASICSACFLFSKYAANNVSFRKKAAILVGAYTRGMYVGETKDVKLSPSSSAGSLSTWLYLKRGIQGFDLEHDGTKDAKPSLTDLTTRGLVRQYQKKHYEGIVCVMKSLIKGD